VGLSIGLVGSDWSGTFGLRQESARKDIVAVVGGKEKPQGKKKFPGTRATVQGAEDRTVSPRT
jgi:hypothetical protein